MGFCGPLGVQGLESGTAVLTFRDLPLPCLWLHPPQPGVLGQCHCLGEGWGAGGLVVNHGRRKAQLRREVGTGQIEAPRERTG